MVIVYYKGVFDRTFSSLIEAENYVHSWTESGMRKEEDYAYSFY